LIGPEHERAQPPSGAAFADAVTFAFGDADAGVFGLARLGLAAEAGSALAVLFSGREPVAALARGGLDVPGGADWESLSLDDLSAAVVEPLRRWTVSLAGSGHGFELSFTALGPPAALDAGSPVARLGGMTGYEQVCSVEGTVRVGGRAVAVACLGQRGHQWGEPDWSRIEAARTIAAWPEGGLGVSLVSVRPAGEGGGHAAEPVWAALLSPDGAIGIAEPRLSTTYDADGHQRRAGLELWIDETDEYAHRGSGEVLCGSTLELGQLQLDCAFFRWRVDGRTGVGRYDILRRAAANPAA
jgi:hypothetical protein